VADLSNRFVWVVLGVTSASARSDGSTITQVVKNNPKGFRRGEVLLQSLIAS